MLTSGWNLTWECLTSTIKTLDLGINLLSSKSADFIFCQMCLITDQVLLAPTLAESNPQTARGIDSTQHDSLNIITFHAQVNKKPSITSNSSLLRIYKVFIFHISYSLSVQVFLPSPMNGSIYPKHVVTIRIG